MKIKVDIISGFLGAGKTTLIKKLIKEKLFYEKLVIIENEFGEIGIDGSLLKKTGIEIKEINSGCICCTLAGDFEKAVSEVIQKYSPERIIIEPSGVGKLSDIIKSCKSPRLKDLLNINMLITVVDTERYAMYLSNFGEFFKDQIKSAKTVILSRTQKCGSTELEQAVSSINALNSTCNVITTPWEDLNAEIIISAAEQNALELLEKEIRNACKNEHSHCGCGHEHGHSHSHCGCGHEHGHSHSGSADDTFTAWGAETPKIYSQNQLEDILKSISESKSYGMVLRGKGILQVQDGRWVQFDYVSGEYDIKSTSSSYTGRLCIIGRDLKKDRLCELFKVNTQAR
ncbi:G3E family GTPase [Anaerobacterium chartisolvens]|uniref:G3E family GTPase n=1 Tax=Anaerobacterium chartisolvens TaxID=1297424 RepID=A0A369BBU4_9FIRM|nr:GTP-binding protein [Anaerobacterium chartisolvens]RCX18881.1 G3E family GTPase [Anaerobacterium chartisolvens]